VGDRLDAVYAALEPGMREQAAVADRRWRRTQVGADALERSGTFVEVAVSRFPWARRYDSASWIAFLRSHSDHQTLPRERRERLLAALGEAIDELGGDFEVAYETVLVSARRR
jgi:hypothetical protein